LANTIALAHDNDDPKSGLVAGHPLVSLGRLFERDGFDHGFDVLQNAKGECVFVLDRGTG